MSPAGDMGDEMTDHSLDEAFDRYLAGRPVPAQAAALVAFADDVRAVAARPGRPSPQLAQLLTGGLHGASDPAAVGAVPVPGAAQPTRHRREKRTLFRVLTGAVTRVTPAGAVAQAALGLGVVLAGVTGAGAAGILPDPVQDEVSTVLEAVTPFDVPNSAHETSTGGEEPATQGGVVTETGEAQDGESPGETPAQAEFGRRVSDDAKGDDGVAGQDISDRARASHGPDVPPAPAPRQPATERPAPANPATEQGEKGGSAPSPAGPTLPGSPGDPEPRRP
jgi:hypothetical protein